MNTIKVTVAFVLVVTMGTATANAQRTTANTRIEYYKVENGTVTPYKAPSRQIYRIDPALKIVEHHAQGKTRYSTDGGSTWKETVVAEDTRSTTTASQTNLTDVSSPTSHLSVFPNPTNTHGASCRVGTSGRWTLDLLDSRGSMLFEIDRGTESSNLSVTFGIGKLPNGQYFVRLSDKNGAQIRSLIKQ